MEVIIKQLSIIINLLERICYKMGIEPKRKEELMNEKIELGASVVDTVTLFSGTVVARAEYLYGSTRLEVQPRTLTNEGDMVKSKWIDESRLRLG